MKNLNLHVKGTHCNSCKFFLEDTLQEEEYIEKVTVDLKKEIIYLDLNQEYSHEEIIDLLNPKIKNNGYTLHLEKTENSEIKNTHSLYALGIGLLFLLFFFALQKTGILNFGIGGQVTPTTSFLIGLIASVSSCLAVVGGLILSLSAKVTQDENRKESKKQFIIFHISRIVGFGLLGGILGSIGEVFKINFTLSSILGIIASIVMISLGLHLTGVFKKNKMTLPNGIFKYFKKIEHSVLSPILLGIGTFFLPCGFTQAMQIVALTSGSFLSGALIMSAFSLGTLPVLSILSFSSIQFSQSKYASLFFKSAGVVVIGLGIFSLLGGLAGLGIINPILNL